MTGEWPWPLFTVFGIELEYMIVERDSLAILPCADELLREAAGAADYVQDVEREQVAWSNELVSHVIELKTQPPAASLDGLAGPFLASIREINERLRGRGAMLVGSGSHPFMDPASDTRLWPHGDREIYLAYDRIFGCRGHGWSNLQSTHLNLPFGSDEEFGRLHAAIRLVLPIIPALAASSPYLDGRYTGYMDARLETYRHNQARVPSLGGRIVPEPLFTHADYLGLLETIRADIAPHDPAGILNPLFLNSRGAIARFDRGAIEIRVIDVQECPSADLAILAAIVAVARRLVDERSSPYRLQQQWPEDLLADILMDVVRDAEQARITDGDYLRMLGLKERALTAGQAWRAVCEAASADFDAGRRWVLRRILDEGPLARRLVKAAGAAPPRKSFVATWRELGDCLADDRQFP